MELNSESLHRLCGQNKNAGLWWQGLSQDVGLEKRKVSELTLFPVEC